MKKKYNDIKQYLNKGISTTAGILIVASVVVVAGGIITWQVWPTREAPSPYPTVSPTPTTTPSPSPTPPLIVNERITNIDSPLIDQEIIARSWLVVNLIHLREM